MVKKKNILTYTKSFEHMYLRSGSLGVQKQPKCGNYRPQYSWKNTKLKF
jgi:hypothetical protein